MKPSGFPCRRNGLSATRFHRRLVVPHGVRGSSIHASAYDGFTSKLNIDATKAIRADAALFEKATVYASMPPLSPRKARVVTGSWPRAGLSSCVLL